MLLKYLYDEQLAQASYVIGCPETRQALVIDPSRDIESYLQAVEAHNLTLVAVLETHIHADFVSGVRELAWATGAKIYLSREGGSEWQYAYPDEVILVREGDKITIGRVQLDVLHTPGHTPEHIAFLVTDLVASQEPFALVSGDCLFVGDVGRPLQRVADVDRGRGAAVGAAPRQFVDPLGGWILIAVRVQAAAVHADVEAVVLGLVDRIADAEAAARPS